MDHGYGYDHANGHGHGHGSWIFAWPCQWTSMGIFGIAYAVMAYEVMVYDSYA